MEFSFLENQQVPKEKFDTVPEDFRGLYKEGDEGYVLNTEDPGVKSAVSAITGLNKALVAARGEARDAKKSRVDLSPLRDFGETPEEIAEAVKGKIEEAGKSKNDDVNRQVDKIKQELAQAHVQEKEGYEKRIEALRGQLYSHLVESNAVKALSEAGAIDPDLILPMLKQHVLVSEEDGEFRVSVVDDSGDPRYSGATGGPMTIKELVAEMKANEKYGPLFKSESRQGGGAEPNQRRTTARQQQEMSATDKIAAGLGRRK